MCAQPCVSLLAALCTVYGLEMLLLSGVLRVLVYFCQQECCHEEQVWKTSFHVLI